jgi:hypothetical protein
MSVTISAKPKDKLNTLYLKPRHPLETLDDLDLTDDDVAFVEIPFEMLEELRLRIESAIKGRRGLIILYTGDIVLRHEFSFFSEDGKGRRRFTGPSLPVTTEQEAREAKKLDFETFTSVECFRKEAPTEATDSIEEDRESN